MSNASLELGGGNWAAKDGKLLGYAVGDTSGKYLPREFDFSRGADIGATRVNKDGLIEKFRENLLLYSNEFNAPWENIRSSDSSGEIGYDGSNNAWKFKDSIDNNTHRIDQNVTLTDNSVYSFSIYAKEGEHNTLGVEIGNFGVTGNYVLFNLSDGTTSETGSIIRSSMTAVGNGWYRCSMTSLAGSADRLCMQVQTDSTGSYVGNGTDGIYIQDAQLERGLVATDYLESGSTTGKAGVLDNLPRIDYTSGSAQLLMEPSRTNLLEHSEYFAYVYFGKANVDVDASDILSPEGKSNSYKVTETTSNGQHAINVAIRPTLTAGSHTHSCFVKANGVTDIVFYNNGTSGGAGVNFDLSAESYSTLTGSATAASIESYGNGWYRISMTFTAVVGTTGPTIYLRTLNSYAGDGVSGIYVYGMQTEAGSYATSYIPNYGTALGVTRNFDYFDDQSYNDVLGNGDLSVFVDFDYAAAGREGSTTAVYVYSGPNTFGIKGTNPTNKQLQVYAGAGFTTNITFNTAEQATRIKALIRTNGTTVELFFNGAKQGTTMTFGGSLPYAWDDIRFTGSNSFLAKYNRIAIFTESLSDAECIALTTV